jgi:hypothetical protein
VARGQLGLQGGHAGLGGVSAGYRRSEVASTVSWGRGSSMSPPLPTPSPALCAALPWSLGCLRSLPSRQSSMGPAELRGGGVQEVWGRLGPGTPSPSLGPQEIVDWFNALRAARFHYLQVAFPGASDADVSSCPGVTGHGVGTHTQEVVISVLLAPSLGWV